MKKLWAGIIIFTTIFVLLSCTPVIDSKKSCSLDTDCFPSECCHANDSLNQENALKCSGVLCTQECVPKTIDCGQGEVKCLKGQCQVVMKK